MKTKVLKFITFAALPLLMAACRDDKPSDNSQDINIGEPEFTTVNGFYVLNAGNMGSNKSTLDYYDYSTATYTTDIFAKNNPEAVMGLGDVGNDLAIYNDRLFAVINGSNKIVVMKASNAEKISEIQIANPRYITFNGDFAYVTSYAGIGQETADFTKKGHVAKIDLRTFKVVDRIEAGYQPEDLAITDGKLYVANSGGYMAPNYDNTLSVIDLSTFKLVESPEIAINLQYVKVDPRGDLWISSRGDYGETSPYLYCYDPRTKQIKATIPVSIANLWLSGNKLYTVSNEWSNITMTMTPGYNLIDTENHSITSTSFINSESAKEIATPYAIAVNPATKEIVITDAGNYVSPGYVYDFDSDGGQKWRVRAGDIPAAIAFVGKK